MNPIDILGVDPHGAHLRTPDARDYDFHGPEIAQATAPFDWEKGYDVEADIASALGATGFQLPTKNQGQAGSCGGEAISEYGQAITSIYLKDTTEKSAKAPYAQVFAPGGGSNDRELANIYVKQGIYKEALVPSYPSPGVAPTEAFMERVNDITPAARLDAAREAALIAYSFPMLDIDNLALALSVSKGLQVGLYGINNGTWLGENPVPPTAAEIAERKNWSHYMYFGKAFLEKGVKKIWGKQSWGTEAAPQNNSWQKFGEEFFNGAIWSAMALILSNKPAAKPTYTFDADLHEGDRGDAITQLQTVLAYDGEFNLAPSGYYGPITAQAVLKFQLKYNLASLATLEELGGGVAGPATRAKLNQLT